MINFSSHLGLFTIPRLLRGALAAVLVLVVALVLPIAGEGGHSVRAESVAPLTSADAARLVAEAPRLNDVRLSPDGSSIVYSVSRGSVADNQYVTELLLQALADGAARGEPVRLDRNVTRKGNPAPYTPMWCPDGSCVTYFTRPAAAEAGTEARSEAAPTLMRYDIGSGRVSPILVRDSKTAAEAPEAVGPHGGRPRITAVGGDYQWSPRGTFIAFTAALGSSALDPRGGVHASAQSLWLRASNRGLFALDPSTGAVEQVSPESLHVQAFDWAPDEHAVALQARPDALGAGSARSDLYIIERSSRSVRALVSRPGRDEMPRWSPDGQWIAFKSQFGEPNYHSVGSAAVVPAAGGEVVRLGGADDPQPASFGSGVFWMPHGGEFLYSSRHHMTSRLIRADIAARRVAPVSADEEPYEANFSFSADGRWLAFTRESATTPPELFVQPFPNGAPRQLTRLTADFPLASLVRIDRVSWPSRDGKFTIHGILLTPRSAWPQGGTSSRPSATLPTLVCLHGGPSMVTGAFSDGCVAQSMPALAARGYAVIAPNTRGRAGYGEAFQRGMSDGKSTGRLPYEDLMAGVDELMRRGIADGDRLGVFGHSYGGYLTSYTITQTDRFRAAVVNEGGYENWLTQPIMSAPGTDWALMQRDIHGIGNPFDATERARLIAEFPAFNMDRVSTPTLLLYGAIGNGSWKVGMELFGGLQRFKVPSEYLLYDEGHGFRRPAALADSITRTANWFDYWLRGMPYPDAERAREYDAWRAARQPQRTVSSTHSSLRTEPNRIRTVR